MSARRWARVALVAIGALAAAEWVASAWAYRDRVDTADLEAVPPSLEPGVPVWLATPWLGPRARMTIPALADPAALARPDLRGVSRFSVLGVGDTWSDELQADLEDLPVPQLQSSRTFGALVLATYEQPAAGKLVDDLLGDPARLRVGVDDERCKGRLRWRCTLGEVRRELAEIDFRPRDCLSVSAEDGAVARVQIPDLATGDVMRGHLGFPGFNARLRSDAAVELTVRIDGVAHWRGLFTDAQGWRPFALRTTPGVHAVTLEVVTAARGTWDRGGYDGGRTHAACVELRTFQEGA